MNQNYHYAARHARITLHYLRGALSITASEVWQHACTYFAEQIVAPLKTRLTDLRDSFRELYRDYHTVCILSIVIAILLALQIVSVVYIYNLRASQDIEDLRMLQIEHESDSIRMAEIKYVSFKYKL